MTSFPRFAAAGALAAVLATPALAATSHSHHWTNKNGKVACGYRVGHAGQLLCSAKGIPRPKSGPKVCDAGFVTLTKTGKPRPTVLCQDEFPAGNPKTLVNGSSWSGLGIACTVGATVTCTNQSYHGFTIGNGKYKSF